MAVELIDYPKPGLSPKSRPYRKRALTQIVELQKRAFAIANDPSLKESVCCFAMRSWCMLQEERRKLEMRPLPKPVDVTKLPGKLARVKQLKASFEEPGPTTGSVQAGSDKPEQAK